MSSNDLIIFNRFSDRDLMMRFRGGGVGHKSTREATDFFKKDRDHLDTQDKADENQVGYVSEEENAEDEEEDYGYIQD
jgi:hypothetical protein